MADESSQRHNVEQCCGVRISSCWSFVHIWLVLWITGKVVASPAFLCLCTFVLRHNTNLCDFQSSESTLYALQSEPMPQQRMHSSDMCCQSTVELKSVTPGSYCQRPPWTLALARSSTSPPTCHQHEWPTKFFPPLISFSWAVLAWLDLSRLA